MQTSRVVVANRCVFGRARSILVEEDFDSGIAASALSIARLAICGVVGRAAQTQFGDKLLGHIWDPRCLIPKQKP
jgi:hypothetical protein